VISGGATDTLPDVVGRVTNEFSVKLRMNLNSREVSGG
jgi:hypothetical protein